MDADTICQMLTLQLEPMVDNRFYKKHPGGTGDIQPCIFPLTGELCETPVEDLKFSSTNPCKSNTRIPGSERNRLAALWFFCPP